MYEKMFTRIFTFYLTYVIIQYYVKLFYVIILFLNIIILFFSYTIIDLTASNAILSTLYESLLSKLQSHFSLMNSK